MEVLFASVIILLWGYWAVRNFIKEEFNIETKKGYINKFHKWGEILLIALCTIFFLLINSILPHYLHVHVNIVLLAGASLIIITGAFRTFMEWRFERASKQYLLTILSTVFGVILLICVSFILPDGGGVIHTDNGMIRYVYLGTGFENKFFIITHYRGTDTEVIIPSYVSGLPIWGIDDSAFADATGLMSIYIPNGTVFINRDTFRNSGLVNVTIPESILFIGQNAFGDSINLSAVYFESKRPPTTIEEGAFVNISPGARAVVPTGAMGWPPEGTNWHGLIITYLEMKP